MSLVDAQTRKIDLSFKKLISKQYSDPGKQAYEEQGIIGFKLGASDVWVEDIPSDPLIAITEPNLDGHPIAEGVRVPDTNADGTPKKDADGNIIYRAEGAIYKLTRITATNAPYAYYAYEDETKKDADGNIISPRYTGFISDLYGQAYTAKLFINGTQISTTQYGWLFDYVTGTLTLLDTIKDFSTAVVTIQAYRYIGRTVKEAVGETFDEDLGNLIIQPNKKINLEADIDTYKKLHGITA